MLASYLKSFFTLRQPWITRQSYAHEIITASTYPVAIALVEGGVIGILAAKAFNVSPLQFATIMAAPNFANLTSFVWATWARGKRKVVFLNRLQYLLLMLVAAIALLPTNMLGAWLLTLQIILIRGLAAGVVTLRSTIWRHNYPRHVRASVTGRITLLQSLIMAIAPLLGYGLLDPYPWAFRYVYLAGAVIATVGAMAYGKVRLRGEKELLAFERGERKPTPHGSPGSIYEFDPTPQQDTFWSVLRHDHMYRRYMVWQFVAGGSNMMGETVLVFVIADMTRHLNNGYLTAITLTTALPMVMAVLTLPVWARQLDHTHITRFRANQSWWWVADQATNWLGVMSGSLGVLAVARIIQGAARSAGMLAWNLGHNDFASRKLVALYMGIHVTLTGVRGAIVPFLGMFLYAGMRAWEVPGLNIAIPAFGGLQAHVFLITTLLMILSNRGFTNLAAAMTEKPKTNA